MSLKRKKSNELRKVGKSIEITNKLICEIDSRENKIHCPRCLGKGHVDNVDNVDNEDIKRLKKELYWAPGPCAYCVGIGSCSLRFN